MYVHVHVQKGEYRAMAYMELHGIPLAALNSDKEGWSWTKRDKRIAITCIDLMGTAEVRSLYYNHNIYFQKCLHVVYLLVVSQYTCTVYICMYMYMYIHMYM